MSDQRDIQVAHDDATVYVGGESTRPADSPVRLSIWLPGAHVTAFLTVAEATEVSVALAGVVAGVLRDRIAERLA